MDKLPTSWVKPGTKVVVFSTNGRSAWSLGEATIEKVNKASFRVSGRDTLFDLVSGEEKRRATWSTVSVQVLPLNTKGARWAIAEAKRRIALDRMQTAVDAVRNDPENPDKIGAVVEAASILKLRTEAVIKFRVTRQEWL